MVVRLTHLQVADVGVTPYGGDIDETARINPVGYKIGVDITLNQRDLESMGLRSHGDHLSYRDLERWLPDRLNSITRLPVPLPSAVPPLLFAQALKRRIQLG